MQYAGIEWTKEVPTLEIEPIDPAFRRVWSRVSSGGPSVPPFVSFPSPEAGPDANAESAPLSRQLRGERQRRQAYLRMGLAGPAGDCLERLRLLTAARFFCYDAPSREDGPLPQLTFPSWCQGVRSLWLLEDAARGEYLSLAEAAGSEPLRQALERCAGLCRTTQERLWRMVQRGV